MTDKQVGGKKYAGRINLLWPGNSYRFKIRLLETNVFTNNSTGITTKDMSLSLVVNVYVLSNELTNWLTKISPEKKCASVQIYNHVKAFYQFEQYMSRELSFILKSLTGFFCARRNTASVTRWPSNMNILIVFMLTHKQRFPNTPTHHDRICWTWTPVNHLINNRIRTKN